MQCSASVKVEGHVAKVDGIKNHQHLPVSHLAHFPPCPVHALGLGLCPSLTPSLCQIPQVLQDGLAQSTLCWQVGLTGGKHLL